MNRPCHHTPGLPVITAESTLGRLAKWLRLAGLDVLLDRNTPHVARLRRLSRDPQRIVLTRTRRVYQSLGPQDAIFIHHNRLENQLRQVIRALGIKSRQLRPLTRCASCNRELVPVHKDQLRQVVPEYVWHQCDSFSRCPLCHKVYWQGTHSNAMKIFMKSWFTAAGP